MQGQLLKLTQVAQYLQVDGKTVLRMVASGELAGRKIGGQWRFVQQDVQSLVDKKPAAGGSSDRYARNNLTTP